MSVLGELFCCLSLHGPCLPPPPPFFDGLRNRSFLTCEVRWLLKVHFGMVWRLKKLNDSFGRLFWVRVVTLPHNLFVGVRRAP